MTALIEKLIPAGLLAATFGLFGFGFVSIFDSIDSSTKANAYQVARR